MGRKTGAGGRRVSVREAEWQDLTDRVTESLGCLEDGNCLILQTRDDEPYYVQVRVEGQDAYAMEAVSNRFLHGWRQLDPTAESRLRALAWRPPTDIGEGPPNWWCQYRQAEGQRGVAQLTIATLRKVYGVPRPCALVYRAFSPNEGEILLPTVGLQRLGRQKKLTSRVDDFLRRYLETDEIIVDDDGDRPIRFDDAMVFVRVMSDPGYVAVFSPAILGVTRTPELVDAVNDINCSIRIARASVAGEAVVIAAEVEDQGDITDGLTGALNAVSSLSNFYGTDLRSRFKGRSYFENPVEDQGQPSELGCGLYL